MADLHPTLVEVTRRIRLRSAATRGAYLDRIAAASNRRPERTRLSCTNLAHGFAACADGEKGFLKGDRGPNVAIVSAYNDMLSAHQPLQSYPDEIKAELRRRGATAQFAGGVPAMCDGVTQGQPGMELSLFSRDVIAQATAIALSHNMFDAALCLGVCDKIVPGLLMGALSFGHLPVIFIPAGPMPSGLPNKEKARVRALFAQGKVGREELLAAEAQAYHSPGTCTFYGTANSNQMLMEIMGLHMPGSAFVNPGLPLRAALTRASAARVADITNLGDQYLPVGRIVDERSLVNGIVGLLATGGSTNHTLHLIAIGRVAGVRLDWGDFAELSRVVPLLARVYPNGSADVNQFHAAGGMAFLIRELLDSGLLHPDVLTISGQGLDHYARTPELNQGGDLAWQPPPPLSGDPAILRHAAEPFSADGGLKLLTGNLGRAVIKTSAVAPAHHRVRAPARIFHDQDAVLSAFRAGELERDLVVVVRFQGPRANGMPELHKLTPALGVLLDRGFQVALVTDGRMSGASGKVPAAIHVTPEAAAGGDIARLRDGDPVLLDCGLGVLAAEVDEVEWSGRTPVVADLGANQWGCGRELFGSLRDISSSAEQGACTFGFDGPAQETTPGVANPNQDPLPVTAEA